MQRGTAGWLARASPAAFSAYAVVAAFSAYFCMYAFRKPFTAATFAEQHLWGVDLKVVLVIGQIVGYALSKFLSIKLVVELSPNRRAMALVALIAWAELALLFFAFLPPAGMVLAIFLNGLPLGAVWGLVFGFLEGRRTSEILGAGLSTSYIVASGAVKSVGRWLLVLGVPEAWMPFVTGMLFVAPFGLSVAMLRALPPPGPEDRAERTNRSPMTRVQRLEFLGRFAFGLLTLTVLYMFLTAYRDFRDNFAAEIWIELGMADVPAIFTYTEVPVALIVLVTLALVYRIKDNRLALLTVHVMMLVGAALIGVATIAFASGTIEGITWMVLIGTGLYMGYVPYGCVLFDRLIAATGVVGTAVFMIYVTDAFGYLGSILVLLFRHFGDQATSWLSFFVGFSYVTSIVCVAAFFASTVYFARRTP